MSELVLEFPVDHPCGAGHFPGNPIIPGALLLAEVLDAIAKHLVLDGRWQVKSAKFPLPVRPGDKVHIAYSQNDAGEIRFEASVSSHRVLSGVAHSLPTSTAGAPA
ncbi:MAG TPA: hypothetical protein VFK88_10040 [Gallionella sp.]|nr:hypothetical protein [Gallionella sp.]